MAQAVHHQGIGNELYCLILQSERDKYQGVATPDSSYLSVDFNNQLNLDTTKHYTIALHKGIISNSWKNISPELNNDAFTYNGNPFVIAPGHHSIKTLQDEMNRIANSTIRLEALYYDGTILIHNDGPFPLVLGTLAKVLGFPVGVTIPGNSQLIGGSKADFTGGVKMIKIECNLVDMRYSRDGSRESRILHTVTPFHTRDVPPYSYINVVEFQPHYVHMTNETSIQRLDIRILDQNNNQIYLDDEFTEFCVCVREKPGIPPPLVPNHQI